MHWLLGAAVCLVRGHKPTLWSRPTGPLTFCIRCGKTLDNY